MPRDTLTRDQIVEAAIELLDAEGLDGLSMRALGRRLGAAPTAMYWHVGSKDQLVVLAGDRVWGEITLSDPEELGWRAAARALAFDVYAMARRHPWLMSAISTYFVYGPGMARFQDHCFAVYEAAGFTGWDLDWAANSTFTFVAGAAVVDTVETSILKAEVPRGRGQEGEPIQDVLDWATGIARQYPRLSARVDAQEGADHADLAARKLEFGIEAMLDGLEARLAAAAVPPGWHGSTPRVAPE